MAKRVTLDQARTDINEAFFGLMDDEPEAAASKARLMEFVAQVEADQRELATLREQLRWQQARIAAEPRRAFAPF